MTSVSLKCNCGQVQGTAHNINAKEGTRVICCCDDCQAFAKHLNAEDMTLDQFGGTEVFQSMPAQMSIEQGQEHLRCLRHTKKGILRWYASCCKTPVANTIKASMPFVGLIHTFMDLDNRDDVLGPVRAHVQIQHAIGTPDYPNKSDKFPLALTGRMIRKVMLGRLQGKQSPSVFFGDDGRPCVKPVILNT